MKSKVAFLLLIVLAVFSILLAGCVPAVSTPPATDEAPDVALTQIAQATEAPPPPTATSTPLPGLVILLAQAEAQPEQVQAFQTTLAELAAQDGLRFETRAQAGELDESVRIVVVLAPDPGLASLAVAHPQIHFLSVAIPGVQAQGNISALASQGERPDWQGFLAGYLAAVITENWRVGVISRSDSPAGNAARLGFTNGAIFFCGLCRPAVPPFFQYPLSATLAAGAGPEAQQVAADSLLNSVVQTVYVFPGAGDNFLLEYLAKAGVRIIGGSAPAPEFRARWVAAIHSNLLSVLRESWDDLLGSSGGLSLSPALEISDVNSEFLSPGRLRLVDQMRQDLLSDFIDTGVDPLSGEAR
jgi:hypothetical protein